MIEYDIRDSSFNGTERTLNLKLVQSNILY